MTSNIETLSFEDALEKLENIIAQLEDREIKLEIATKLYIEGKKLQKHCEKKLKEAQLKIDQIAKKDQDIVLKENIIL